MDIDAVTVAMGYECLLGKISNDFSTTRWLSSTPLIGFVVRLLQYDIMKIAVYGDTSFEIEPRIPELADLYERVKQKEEQLLHVYEVLHYFLETCKTTYFPV